MAVPSLIRFSDSYKSLQMWGAASQLGQRTTAQPYLTQLEQAMGDEESGVNNGLDAFFGALNAASVDPTSSPLRQQIITAADALAQRFQQLHAGAVESAPGGRAAAEHHDHSDQWHLEGHC